MINSCGGIFHARYLVLMENKAPNGAEKSEAPQAKTFGSTWCVVVDARYILYGTALFLNIGYMDLITLCVIVMVALAM